MRRVSKGSRLARLLVVAGLAIVASGGATAQTDDLAALNRRVSELYSAAKFGEAIPLAEKSLQLTRTQQGEVHLDTAARMGWLATLYEKQGRYAEADPLYRGSLSIHEKALGPDHPAVGIALNNLALLYQRQGRYTEAELLYKRSLALWEKALGVSHPNVGSSLNNLTELYREQGRYAEAEPLYRRLLGIREKALGPDHPDVGRSLNNLAALYQSQGRYAEAEPLNKRSLGIWEKALGPEHPDVGTAINNLAELYRAQGRTTEAEPLYKRSLALHEKTLGPDHPSVGTLLNNLAGLYHNQGRTAEAEPLYKRSLSIREKALGPDHPDVGGSLNDLATLYENQGRYAESEPLYKRSLALYEKALGPDHTAVGTAINNLAALYLSQGRFAEAEPLYKRTLGTYEKALGPEHPNVGASLNGLAELYRRQGRYAEAEPQYRRGLALLEKALGPDHPSVGRSLNNLAGLYFVQRDWARAADYWRGSTALLQRRAERGLGSASGGSSMAVAARSSWQFTGLVRMTYRIAVESRAERARQAGEMFQTAQWAHASEAAASLAEMAARSATGSTELAALVRERQDLVAEWRVNDKQLIAAKSEPPDRRNVASEKAVADRLGAIDTRLAGIDVRLAKDFPDYAALSSPKPISVAEVQADLSENEALMLFLDTPNNWVPIVPEETFIWVVTKTDVRWVRSELGTSALVREVAALRCGLDATAWSGEGAANCTELLKIAPGKAPMGNTPLPFDLARAHGLYKALFGQVEDLIKGKHLLLVPSGSLTPLPFQVLVTAPPRSGPSSAPASGRQNTSKGSDPKGQTPSAPAHRSVAWLARSHALTVLPAVSSLKALRRVARPSAAKLPMIGFGNPLLDGDQNHAQHGAYYKRQAQLARDKQRCRETVAPRVATLFSPRPAVEPVNTRGGLADLAQLKVQSPLPETADELCAVARDLKADVSDIRLGARATEREVKALSASGRLAQYRILHFATHGMLTGQLSGTSEPGLILTPPAKATEDDDGYLSAGEIAGLKLDADWVILSACNTAGPAGGGQGKGPAGGEAGAEALGGLARAFFYAQARALLVSHWEVDSTATVQLITSAVGAISRDRNLGRAEALRRAMLAMIDKGAPHEAHPATWAPFVLVGEGGTGQ